MRAAFVILGDLVVSAAPGTYRVGRSADNFSEYQDYNIPNWDGENAHPISTATIETARRFSRLLPRDTPAPDIAPGADGTIGFEWRMGSKEHREFVLIEVGVDNLVRARKISENGTVSRFDPIRAESDAVQHLLLMLFP